MTLSLQDAYYHTIHDHAGGADALAPRLSPPKSPGQLCHEARPPEGSSAKAGLLTAAQLVDLTGDKRIVHAFCARAGGMFLPLPTVDPLGGENLLSAVGRLAAEFGELVGTITQVSADGQIKLNEMRQVEKEATDLMAALHQALQLLADQHKSAKR